MREITELQIAKKQLAEQQYYYHDCKTVETKHADTAKQPLLDLAADVLIQILRKESEE